MRFRVASAARLLVQAIFAVAMLATYGSFAAGIVGYFDARSVSLISLTGAGIGSLATLMLIAISGHLHSRSRWAIRD